MNIRMSHSPMWAECYRPMTLEDCIMDGIQDRDRDWLRSLKASKTQLPNILFYGPPGTGKTTLARILANEDGIDVVNKNGSTMGKHLVADLEKAVSSLPIFDHYRLFLIEEADGITQ